MDSERADGTGAKTAAESPEVSALLATLASVTASIHATGAGYDNVALSRETMLDWRDQLAWCSETVAALGWRADADSRALTRERRRVAAVTAVLGAPMWESDDEIDSTICRCEWCLAATEKLAATYRCRECGYQGQPMAWGCLDPENVERMSRERGERYALGNVTCPICGEREFDADPWQALRAIRQALADAPGQSGEEGERQ